MELPGPSEFPYYINAVLSPPQTWQVQLAGDDDVEIKSFEGYGGRIEAQWDGLDAEGNIVDRSAYPVTLTALESGVSLYFGCINKLT